MKITKLNESAEKEKSKIDKNNNFGHTLIDDPEVIANVLQTKATKESMCEYYFTDEVTLDEIARAFGTADFKINPDYIDYSMRPKDYSAKVIGEDEIELNYICQEPFAQHSVDFLAEEIEEIFKDICAEANYIYPFDVKVNVKCRDYDYYNNQTFEDDGVEYLYEDNFILHINKSDIEESFENTVANILKNKEYPKKGFEFLSSNGDSGEIRYNGVNYAFRKLNDGSYKVMTSAAAGDNWSETLFKDEGLKEASQDKKSYYFEENDSSFTLYDIDKLLGETSALYLGAKIPPAKRHCINEINIPHNMRFKYFKTTVKEYEDTIVLNWITQEPFNLADFKVFIEEVKSAFNQIIEDIDYKKPFKVDVNVDCRDESCEKTELLTFNKNNITEDIQTKYELVSSALVEIQNSIKENVDRLISLRNKSYLPKDIKLSFDDVIHGIQEYIQDDSEYFVSTIGEIKEKISKL